MCGITGIIGRNFDQASHPILEMTKRLEHRGPDASDIHVENKVALGHRRLSIIDLSSGANQPFRDSSGRYIIVYNGELYNFEDLRAQLDYPFRTQSDTEVVLAAFIEWGHDCLSKFNGMFAFAIWDSEQQDLFMARDRLGIKPLYYFLDEEQLIFASEVRSILASGLVPKKVDPDSLSEFLMYQSVRAPRTLMLQVHQLEAGSFATWKDHSFQSHVYWTPLDRESNTDSDIGSIRKNIRELFFSSVEKRMMSDVPFGAFLSGGVDSSAIVGAMSEVSNRPINTFSLVFDDPRYDESEYSTLISKRFKTNHQSVTLKPSDLLDYLPDALDAMDMPSGDGINSFVISKLTRQQGLTVALSGIGGDELFAGYPVFKQYPKLSSSYWWHAPRFLRKALAPLLSHAVHPVKQDRLVEVLTLGSPQFPEMFPILRQIFTKSDLQRLGLNDRSIDTELNSGLSDISSKCSNNQLSKITMGELLMYTKPVLLKDMDQMSMANSLEVRVPFLDHRLVEYLVSIDGVHKSTVSPKRLLVESLDGLLPNEVVNRKKQGFAFPWEDWMRGELSGFCFDALSKLEQFEPFSMESIMPLWDRFMKKDTSVSWAKLWLLVVLGYWLDKNAR